MVGYQDVLEAHGRIRKIIHRTPVLHSRQLDEVAGGRLFFKMESFQRSGAFKFRGAYHALLRSRDRAQRHGTVTASSGNHGGAVALAARLLEIPATVVMPEDAAAVKVAAIRDAGAEVVFCGLTSAERQARALELADRQGLVMIPPYDHPDVIAAQGTAALEALEQVPDLELFLAPCGGGGLLSGCALVFEELQPSAEVWGVEPARANDTALSFEKGERVTTPLGDTMADGARNICPGELTFPIILRCVRGIALVSEEQIARAVELLLTRMKVVSEPTGALAPAAALARGVDLQGRTAVALVSGGNVDPQVLARCCTSRGPAQE